MKLKILLVGYVLTLLGLFFYSFTQIDLSLALSRNPAFQAIVVSFQHIGYFERPLSAQLYILLLVLLFGFYITFLVLATKEKLQKKFVWIIILTAASLLTFSYNAFSYDLFNYIFDARIFTHYQQNPYLHKALDFPSDHMLSFMRWTHRDYPYGPAWLGLTVPLSYAGFQYFLPTFILFKMFIVASYVGSVYFIGKIFRRLAPEQEVFGLVFFALNPLIIIESLVSAHIDMVMMFFALFGVYLLLRKKYVVSYLSFFVSIGIKFVTGFIFPVFIYLHILHKQKKAINWNVIWGACVVLLTLGVFAQTVRGTFQPWYLIDVLAFAVFLSQRYYVLFPSIIISLFALLNYAPFLYTGNWDKPIPQMLANLNYASYGLSLLTIIIYFVIKKTMLTQSTTKHEKGKK
jgi:hypothetical protein